jgi:hypothetical protein
MSTESAGTLQSCPRAVRILSKGWDKLECMTGYEVRIGRLGLVATGKGVRHCAPHRSMCDYLHYKYHDRTNK